MSFLLCPCSNVACSENPILATLKMSHLILPLTPVFISFGSIYKSRCHNVLYLAAAVALSLTFELHAHPVPLCTILWVLPTQSRALCKLLAAWKLLAGSSSIHEGTDYSPRAPGSFLQVWFGQGFLKEQVTSLNSWPTAQRGRPRLQLASFLFLGGSVHSWQELDGYQGKPKRCISLSPQQLLVVACGHSSFQAAIATGGRVDLAQEATELVSRVLWPGASWVKDELRHSPLTYAHLYERAN